MVNKAFSLFLVTGLVLAGIPVGGQDLPNSIKGSVPAGIEEVANAVLQDASGNTISMAPVTAGKFTFRNLSPGEYYVALHSASGRRIARSCAVSLATGASRETSFDCPTPPAAAAPAVARGGLGRTGWILIGAAAVGITTAVVIATNEDEGVASATR